MSSYPPPPPYTPPPGWDPSAQRRAAREQARLYRAQARQMRYQMYSSRRSSILGPLLLIAIGVVFLLVEFGRLTHQAVLQWYGHWWPVIFLFAGIVLLAEWFWDQHRQSGGTAPQYRRSLGGGAFMLLLLLGVVGFGSHAFWHHISGDGFYRGLHLSPGDLDQFLGDKHESDQTVDLALPPGAALAISDPRGDVSVSGTSDDGRIHIAVHKQVYTRTDSEALTKAQELNPVSRVSGMETLVSVPTVEGGSADLTLTVPATAALTVTVNRGDIHVASMKSAVTVTANHGDVDLAAITGPARAHVNSGGASIMAHSLAAGISIEGHAQDVTVSDVRGPVSMSGEFFGTTHLEHIDGAVHFRTSRTELELVRLDGEVEISPHMDLSADQVVGPFILTTSNRNINLDRVSGEISVTNRNGSIELTAAPATGPITLGNRNGSIRTTLPKADGFTVQALTTDGEITTSFPLTAQTNGSRKELNGTVGAGGPLVRITTTNGDITLNSAAVEPLPATAPAPPKLSTVPVAAAPSVHGRRALHAAHRSGAPAGSSTF